MEDKRLPGEKSSGIKEALRKIQVNFVESGVSAKNSDNGSLEFEFGDLQPSGLVFEREDSEVQSVDAALEMKSAESEPQAERKDEFDIPESFSVDEKYNTVSHENEQTKIWTTYVPRFTEASENYRMVNDSRPRPLDSVTVENGENTSPADFDPTAEYEADVVEGAVNIAPGMDVEAEEFSESLNVFKFESADAESIPKAGKPLADEPVVDEAEDEPDDAPLLDEEYVQPENEEPARKKIISIPDPASDAVQVVEYSENQSANNAIAEYRVPPAGVDAAHGGSKIPGEYTAFYQRDRFKDKFLDLLLSSKIRFVAAALLGVMLILFENLTYFGVNVAEFLRLTADPWALSVIDIHLSLCLLLIAIPELVDAVKNVRKGVICTELLLIPSFLVVVACNAVNIDENARTPVLVGAIFAIHSIAVIFSSSLRKSADFTAFKATSLNGEKKVVDVASTRTLPAESIALDGAVDGYKSGTVRIFKASFISDFFKNTAKRTEKNFYTLITLAVALGIALVAAAVAYFVLGGISRAAAMFGTVYLITVPAISLVCKNFSYNTVQKRVAEENSAVIGESALHRFADADVITFDDTEIFGAEDVVLKRFMLYGDRENMSKAMRQMSSLFAVTGGPLDNIFAGALEKRSVPATSAVIENDGLAGNVDGKRVCAGTFEYMLRHGIEVNSDKQNTDNGADTTRVMYAAENGIVYAKFYIRYSFSEEFSALLPSLREKKIVPLIYTRDPNVSNDLLRTLTAGQGAMRVMKISDVPESGSELYSKIGAGMVTFGDKMNAIRSVLLAKKHTELCAKNELAGLAVAAVGCVASTVLGFVGIGIPSMIGAAWHIACCAAVCFVNAKIFKPMKTKDNESD